MFNSRILKYLDNDWDIFDTCYEYADDAIAKAKKSGFKEVKSFRVQSDTKGLAQFLVLVKTKYYYEENGHYFCKMFDLNHTKNGEYMYHIKEVTKEDYEYFINNN